MDLRFLRITCQNVSWLIICKWLKGRDIHHWAASLHIVNQIMQENKYYLFTRWKRSLTDAVVTGSEGFSLTETENCFFVLTLHLRFISGQLTLGPRRWLREQMHVYSDINTIREGVGVT